MFSAFWARNVNGNLYKVKRLIESLISLFTRFAIIGESYLGLYFCRERKMTFIGSIIPNLKCDFALSSFDPGSHQSMYSSNALQPGFIVCSPHVDARKERCCTFNAVGDCAYELPMPVVSLEDEGTSTVALRTECLIINIDKQL